MAGVGKAKASMAIGEGLAKASMAAPKPKVTHHEADKDKLHLKNYKEDKDDKVQPSTLHGI